MSMSAFDIDALEALDPTGEAVWDRPYDIVIFGATGYTGQLCVQQLDMMLALQEQKRSPEWRRGGEAARRAAARRRGTERTKFAWAIAGRNFNKLETIARRCHVRPDIIVASSKVEISKMCHSTYVVLSLAGPYAKYGEPVVECCVKNWTHYVDVTGEYVWMREMIDKYHEEAKKRGTLLIFSTGQESAPYDIMAYKAVQRLGPLKRLQMYMFQYGNISGGTALTGVSSIERLSDPEFFQKFNDPFILGGERKRGVDESERDGARPAQDEVFPSLWTFFFGHSSTQVKVIRRTCGLFDEMPADDGVQYGEDFKVWLRDAAPKQNAAEVSFAAIAPPTAENSEQVAEGMKWGIAMGSQPPQGAGSSLEARGLYYSDCYAVAEGENGKWAYVHHTGPDTYEITAICAVCAAMTIVDELDPFYPYGRAGCVTPAWALHGTSWIERCEAYGMAGTKHARMTFDVWDGKPPEEDLYKAMMDRSKNAMAGMAKFSKGEFNPWTLEGVLLPIRPPAVRDRD